MIKAIVPAALAAILVAVSAPAMAAPAGNLQLLKIETTDAHGVTKVAERRKWRREYKHRYRAGGRYDRAPNNWRRYKARPSFWRTRGCVIVGPVWFCP